MAELSKPYGRDRSSEVANGEFQAETQRRLLFRLSRATRIKANENRIGLFLRGQLFCRPRRRWLGGFLMAANRVTPPYDDTQVF